MAAIPEWCMEQFAQHFFFFKSLIDLFCSTLTLLLQNKVNAEDQNVYSCTSIMCNDLIK